MDVPGIGGPALPLAPTLAALVGPPRAAMGRLSKLGFRHVQLSAAQGGLRPRELDRSARRDLLSTLRRHELRPAGLDLFIPHRDHLDPATADRAAAAVLDAIALAGALERCPISLTLPAEGAEGMVESALAEAERWGVELADHQVDPEGDGPVGLGIDPAAWLAVGEDPVAAVIRFGPRLASARLVDLLLGGTRGPVGDPHDGRLDVSAYRVALSVAGYQRPVVLDARQWSRPEEGMVKSKEVWEGG
jgi:sugar phosphate isomerase/epimerase